MRPLPSELLRSFAVVAQTGSFTAASERVSLSQSTVSQQIRRLEDLVGQPLFERDTRHVRLSHHGEILHRYARPHHSGNGIPLVSIANGITSKPKIKAIAVVATGTPILP
jgi:hypothetical protein